MFLWPHTTEGAAVLIGVVGVTLGFLGNLIAFWVAHKTTSRHIEFQQSAHRREVFAHLLARHEALRTACTDFNIRVKRAAHAEKQLFANPSDPSLSAVYRDAHERAIQAGSVRANAQTEYMARQFEATMVISKPKGNPASLAIEVLERTGQNDDVYVEANLACQLAFRSDTQLGRRQRNRLRVQAWAALRALPPDLTQRPDS